MYIPPQNFFVFLSYIITEKDLLMVYNDFTKKF